MSPQQRQASNPALAVVVVVIVVLVCGGVMISGVVSSLGGSDDGNPMLTDAGEKGLAADLADATKTQNICYGWTLDFDDDYSSYGGQSAGSNQGAGQPLDTAQCERWVTFTGSVTWTSSSSESEDYGSMSVDASPGLSAPTNDELSDVGVTLDGLIDSPGDGLEKAVEALPLLMASKGEATPLPPGDDSSAAAEVSPPQSAGSDRWRESKGLLIFGIVILVAAVGLAVATFVTRRRTVGVPQGPRAGGPGQRGPDHPGGPAQRGPGHPRGNGPARPRPGHPGGTSPQRRPGPPPPAPYQGRPDLGSGTPPARPARPGVRGQQPPPAPAPDTSGPGSTAPGSSDSAPSLGAPPPTPPAVPAPGRREPPPVPGPENGGHPSSDPGRRTEDGRDSPTDSAPGRQEPAPGRRPEDGRQSPTGSASPPPPPGAGPAQGAGPSSAAAPSAGHRPGAAPAPGDQRPETPPPPVGPWSRPPTDTDRPDPSGMSQ